MGVISCIHHVMEALCSVPSRIVGGPSLGVHLVLSHSRPMHAFRVLKIKGPKPWCPISTQTTSRETRTNNHESSYKKWKRRNHKPQGVGRQMEWETTKCNWRRNRCSVRSKSISNIELSEILILGLGFIRKRKVTTYRAVLRFSDPRWSDRDHFN